MEAAYVLPLMLVMILMLVDVVVYSSDRLYANDVMADAYHLVMGEASMVSVDNPQQDVLCTAGAAGEPGTVELNATQLQTTITDAFIKIFPSLVAGDIVYDIATSSGVPTIHVITVRFPSHTIFLPDSFAQQFPVEAKLILSIDLKC